jgi:hypothetical protein
LKLTYIEHFLAPTLRVGQVVVDNLSAHKGQRIRKLIEQRGCELLYLPPYSSDLNPIEEAFSKIKRLLRAIGARTKVALVEAIGKALDGVGAWDAKGFFTHCGYCIAGATTIKDAVMCEGMARSPKNRGLERL